MTASETALQFKVGSRVKCRINLHADNGVWFTGTILTILEEGGEWYLVMKRDDATKGSQWAVYINGHTKHLIKPIIGDWDL